MIDDMFRVENNISLFINIFNLPYFSFIGRNAKIPMTWLQHIILTSWKVMIFMALQVESCFNFCFKMTPHYFLRSISIKQVC